MPLAMKISLYTDDLREAPVELLAVGVFSDEPDRGLTFAHLNRGLDGALEQACQRDAVAYAAAFRFFLQFLYEAEVVTEEYILSWEVASAPNDEDDMPSAQKLLREAAAPFFTFLKEEDEESSEGESSDEEDDDDDDDEDSD